MNENATLRAERDALRAVVDKVRALCDESGPRMMSDGFTSYFMLSREDVIAALATAAVPERQDEMLCPDASLDGYLCAKPDGHGIWAGGHMYTRRPAAPAAVPVGVSLVDEAVKGERALDAGVSCGEVSPHSGHEFLLGGARRRYCGGVSAPVVAGREQP